VDNEPAPTAPPNAVSQLEAQAFSNRPEIASQNYEYEAAQRFQKAERDLLLPSVQALGVVGRTPYGSTINGVSPFTPWYGAVGVNLNVPIFNGFLYPARSREAGLRAQAQQEQLRDLKDRIANDVRTSWLNAIAAYNRIAVSQQFLDQANLAINLSQTRYNLGLSSIVELSQAQLQQTQAQIEFAAAKYQYRIAQSVLRFQVAVP
jgi:outer membrane protein